VVSATQRLDHIAKRNGCDAKCWLTRDEKTKQRHYLIVDKQRSEIIADDTIGNTLIESKVPPETSYLFSKQAPRRFNPNVKLQGKRTENTHSLGYNE